MVWDENDIEYVLEHLNNPETLMEPEFEKWLEIENHQIFFEEIRNHREAFLRYVDKGDIDVDAEYRYFVKNKVPKRQIGHQWWWAAAASVMIIFMVALLIDRKGTNVPELAKAEEYIGKKSAELILTSGERVKLEHNVVELRECNGVWITNDTNYQLAYRQDTILNDGDTPEKELVYNTLQIPSGADYVVNLADGTRVRLNCGTEFRFPVAFAKNERRVYLDGEAFFEVKKSGEWPFVVVADRMEVRVIGTCFNVKSYYSDRIASTTLIEGSVEVKSENQPIRLVPSQQFWLDKDSGKSEVRKVDVGLYTGWIDGMFVFKKQRLEEVMDILARWYSIDVFYTNASVKDLRLSANLGRYEHIDTLLQIIQAMDKVKIERRANVVTIGWK